MSVERSYITENAFERERLRALVTRLSDEDLSCILRNGWTIAEALAHLAFWDQLSLVLLEEWERNGIGSSPVKDVDTINEALHRLCKTLPVRAAAQLAIVAAEVIDHELEQITSELAGEIEAAGKIRALRRAIHRREHLDQIEQALRAMPKQ